MQGSLMLGSHCLVQKPERIIVKHFFTKFMLMNAHILQHNRCLTMWQVSWKAWSNAWYRDNTIILEATTNLDAWQKGKPSNHTIKVRAMGEMGICWGLPRCCSSEFSSHGRLFLQGHCCLMCMEVSDKMRALLNTWKAHRHLSAVYYFMIDIGV